MMIALLAVVQAVQATALLAWILHFVPPPHGLTASVVPEWQYLLKPEWEALIFRFFVGSSLLLGWFWFQRERCRPVDRRYLAMEVLLTLLLLAAGFKMAVYDYKPQLATYAAGIVLGAALLNKIAWPWVAHVIEAGGRLMLRPVLTGFLSRLLTVLMPLVIFLIIDVTDVQAVLARFFFGEQFHHNDSFIYGPGWAYVKGCIPNIDIISQYGAGVGVVLGSLAKLLGGFSYETGFLVMMYAVMAYYILCFLFLTRWLKSPAIAAAGVLFMIKIQMFHTGVYPFVFTYGSATVVRYWFDIIFMFAVARHILKPALRFLVMAGLACGAQLFYFPTEGVYLTLAYVFYLGVHFCLPPVLGRAVWSWREAAQAAILAVWPVLAAVMFLRLFIGPAALTGEFWQNIGEFVQYFLSGFGVTPIYTSLKDRQFLASLMGFVMPIVYCVTLLMAGTLMALGKARRSHTLLAVLCVYGLGTYHYYVARSAVTSYYAVAIPYVMVLCFYAKALIDRLGPMHHVRAKALLLLASAAALATNQLFLSYPNRFNLSRNPVTDPLVAQPLERGKPYFHHLFRDFNEQLKVPLNSLGEQDERFFSEFDFTSDAQMVSLYRRESDFRRDADLIKRLTVPGQAVPLISSFEIKMLMQADRRPYFYYFPLVVSNPMRARSLVTISIYTTDQLTKTLRSLEWDRPPYIFVEKVFLERPVPAYFYQYYPAFMLLMDYVLSRYERGEEGQYLVALRRKSNG